MIAVFIGWRRGHSLESLREAAVAQRRLGHRRDLHPARRRRADRRLGDSRHAARDGLLRPAAPEPELLLRDGGRDLRHRRGQHRQLVDGGRHDRRSASWASRSTWSLNPAIAAAAIISGAYFGDTTSPLSDSANLAAATGGVDLYKHIKETAAHLVDRARDRAGRVPDARAAGRLRREREDRGDPERVRHLAGPVPAARRRRRARAVQGAAVHDDLPRRARRRRPRRRSSRPTASSPSPTRDGDDIPRWLALIKGVWLALASGYTASTGHRDDRPARDARRHGEHAQHDLADHHRARVRRRGREGGRARPADHAGDRSRRSRPARSSRPRRLGDRRPTSSRPTSTSRSCCPGGCSRARSRSAASRRSCCRAPSAPPATPTSALVPWNSCGAYMAATLGVATFSYLPYAVFNIASPLLAIARRVSRHQDAEGGRSAGTGCRGAGSGVPGSMTGVGSARHDRVSLRTSRPLKCAAVQQQRK